jgi:hypothetical protein
MDFDRFVSILIAMVLAAIAAYFISGITHHIWLLWTR